MFQTQLEAVIPIKLGHLCGIKLKKITHFDINKIFDCGQSFRFDSVTNSAHPIEFAGCAYGKYISVACDDDYIYIYNTDLDEYERIWKTYLGLDRDYEQINSSILSLSQSASLADALEKSDGIRILRQEAWEALCSFMISQNNNIPRIKKLITALCFACGDPIDMSKMAGHTATAHDDGDGHYYSFPSPERVLSLGEQGLIDLKMGFRAKYIIDAATKIVNSEIDLKKLENMTTKDCIENLCHIKGVGPKVASCALLFGFGKLDAFPIDVWIKKAMMKYFDADFDPDSLGKFAGIAQQYLFYYERYLQQKGTLS